MAITSGLPTTRPQQRKIAKNVQYQSNPAFQSLSRRQKKMMRARGQAAENTVNRAAKYGTPAENAKRRREYQNQGIVKTNMGDERSHPMSLNFGGGVMPQGPAGPADPTLRQLELAAEFKNRHARPPQPTEFVSPGDALQRERLEAGNQNPQAPIGPNAPAPAPGAVHAPAPMQGQVGNAAPPMQGQEGMGITPRRGYGNAMYTRHNFLHPSLRRQLIMDDAMQGRAARKQRLRDRRSGVTARLNQMNPLAAQNWLGQRELMRRNDMLAKEKQAHDIAQAGETNALQRLQEENKVAYQNKELGIRERELGAKRRAERMAFLEKALAAAPSREASQAILNEIDRITRDGGGAAPGGAAPGFGDIMAPDPRRWNPGDRVPDQYIDENGEFDVNAARRDGLDTRRINSMRDQHVASPAPLDSLWDSIASGYLGFPSRDTLHDWGIWRRPTLDNRPASGGPPAAQMPSPAQRRRGVEDLYNRFPFVDPAGNRPILP
ncbi:MAG: hypothetical protein MK165_14235 [Pirellulaceae bacterium]|nr:hypothetical protein [Pirellulaceae bacterium]